MLISFNWSIKINIIEKRFGFFSIFGLDSYFDGTLYSLEKLIEWKTDQIAISAISIPTLYSLEKLIEWKIGFHLGAFE